MRSARTRHLPAWLSRIVGRLEPIAGWLGADRQVSGLLLRTKLVLDLRRARKAGPAQTGLLLSCGINLGLGLMIGMLSFLVDVSWMMVAVVQTLVMVVTMMALVMDYTNVFLDEGDRGTLSPLPIDGRTLVVVRLLHVGLYLTLVSGSLAVFPTILGAIAYGSVPYLLLMPVFSAQSALLATLLVVLLYIGCFRFLAPERAREVILWIQTFALLVVMVGYQLFGSVAGAWMRAGEAAEEPWMLLIPPLHHAATWRWVVEGAGALRMTMASLGFLLPPLACWLAVRLSRSGFAGTLSAGDPGTGRTRRGPWRRLGERSLQAGEAAGFGFAWALSGRERIYRLRVYPSFAVPVITLLPFLVAEVFPLGRDTPLPYCMATLSVLAIVPGVVVMARYTDSPDARWVLEALPVTDRQAFLAGAVKGLLWRYVVPIPLVAVAVVGAVATPEVLGQVALAAVLALVGAFSFPLLFAHPPPFSRAFSPADAQGSTGIFMLAFLLIAVAAGLQFALTRDPLVHASATVAGGACGLLLWRRLSDVRRGSRAP